MNRDMERKIVTLDNLERFYGKLQIELSNNQISVSYNELLTLRTNSQLIPGQQYRITDYTCTTVQGGTKSAGHVFDIIVRADSVNKLNEEAHAIQHTGDSYFTNSNLSAWKIWYCIDNDTTRFTWADNTNGKGVIYRMIDEFNNDVPYDFKNIQFYRQWDSNKSLWSTISYDATGIPCYTFCSNGDSSTVEFTDMSLSLSNNVYSNVIKEYISFNFLTRDNLLTLNNNCFFNGGYENTFGNDCFENTFGSYCRYNSFGNVCNNNSFGSYCRYNSFGNGCYGNTFGNDCYDNSFGNDCYDNSFGSDCYDNSFGNSCYNNSFGNYCKYNSFGNGCHYIKFASDSYASTTYSYYQSNYFGDGCSYILFKGAATGSDSVQVQNYNFSQGLKGTSSEYLTIDGVRNRAYETKVAKDSYGTLKTYCEADLVQ